MKERMYLWFQSSVLGINSVWPYKYLLPPFFSPRVLLFGDIITPKLLCVTCGQNGSILDLGIVIFTGMFSPLKNFFPWCGPQTSSFGIPWDAC